MKLIHKGSFSGFVPKRPQSGRRAGLLFSAGLLLACQANAGTPLWTTRININEFEGSPGGLENEGAGNYVYNNQANPAPATRSYDIFVPSGTDPKTGKTLYAEGQDGISDFTVTTRVIDGSGGRWSSVTADKRSDDWRGSASVAQRTSKPGDYALIAYEFSFSPDLQLTASDVTFRLSNVNSFGEIYQWAFMTVGNFDSSPFDPAAMGTYRNTDYNNIASGTFYGADGLPTGNPGTGGPLEHNISMSQYLAGQPSSSGPSGGAVGPGWYAVDDFHVKYEDGPEANYVNPTAGFPDLPDSQSINTASHLGMGQDELVTDLTVWFGYNDVAFDSNGNGFTMTGSTQRALISYLDVGASDFTPLPEPNTTMLAGLSGCLLLMRRKRKSESQFP